jgi:replicative DNA helicase
METTQDHCTIPQDHPERSIEEGTLDVRRFLRVEEDELIELAVLGGDGVWVFYARGYDEHVRALRESEEMQGTGGYMILNRIDPSVADGYVHGRWVRATTRTSNDRITDVRVIPIDIDPERPSMTSATETQREHARRVAESVVQWCTEQAGVGAVSSGCSGNGYFVLIAVTSTPPTLETTQMQGRFLRRLNEVFGVPGHVKIDKSVAKPSQLMPTPGTTKRKGEPSAERPHRRVTFEGPANVSPVDLASFLKFALEVLHDGSETTGMKSDRRMTSSRRGRPRTSSEELSLFERANRVCTLEVLDTLGIDTWETPRGVMAECPGCAERDSLVCKNADDEFFALKCLHDRCSDVGPEGHEGLRNNVDIVAAREGLEPRHAAQWICERLLQMGEESPDDTEWTEPVPFDGEVPLPSFPVDALPYALRQFIVGLAEATQTPPELTAVLSLGLIAAIVQKKYEVEVRPGWRENLSLFVIVALPSAERKSTVFRHVTQPLRRWEADQASQAASRISEATTAKQVQEKIAKKTMDEAVKSESARDLERAIELSRVAEKTRIPVAPRIFTDDVTPEKLSALLHEHGGRMAVMSAEGGIFETVAGRYCDGTPNLDVLLKGHAGDPLRVDRKSSAPVQIDRPALTLALCVQPEVVQGLSTKPTFRSRGLIARMLLVLPVSRLGFRNTNSDPLDPAVELAFDEFCRCLLNLPETKDDACEIVPTVLKFSPEARQLLEEYAGRIEPRLAPGRDLDPLRDWAGKLPGTVARIAGLLHMAESVRGPEGSEGFEGFEVGEVPGDCVRRAVALGDFFLEHAIVSFSGVLGSSPVGPARIVLEHLRTQGAHTRSKRDLHQALRGRFPRASDLEAPLGLLERHGYIRQVRVQPNGRGGGRPSTLVVVNPAVFGVEEQQGVGAT